MSNQPNPSTTTVAGDYVRTKIPLPGGVTFHGRVGRVDELQYTKNGKAKLRFSIALDHYDYGEKERQTRWINVSVFGPSAEGAVKRIHAGSLVILTAETIGLSAKVQGANEIYAEVTTERVEIFDIAKREGGQEQAGSPRRHEYDRDEFPDGGLDDIPF